MSDVAASRGPDPAETIDFAGSFVTWVHNSQASYGRWTVDSRISIAGPDGEVEAFYLLTGVMAGRVYAEKDLVVQPTMEFRAVFGANRFKIFRTRVPYVDQDESGLIRERFGGIRYDVKAARAETLADLESVVERTLENRSLNGRIELVAVDGRPWCVLEFPVRHINVKQSPPSFQVETGPLLVPPERARGDSVSLDDLRVAFTYFNRFDEAYFVEWGLTSPAGPCPRVRFFREPWSMEARVSVLAPE